MEYRSSDDRSTDDRTSGSGIDEGGAAEGGATEDRRFRRKFAAAGLAAGLIGGGAAGFLLADTPLSGAATGVATQQSDEPAADDPDTGGADIEDPDADSEAPGQDRGAQVEQRRREHLAEVLSPLVEAGTIDQSQADAVIDALIEAQPEGRAGRRGRHGPPLEAAAEAIGVERSELADALRGGSTIAEVAAQHGVDPQAVIDAMVAEGTERIDEALESGRITEERAEQARANLVERTTEFVNEGRKAGAHDGRGGPEGPPDESESDEDAESGESGD